MRGPSSSHCAASVRIGRLARDVMDGEIQNVEIRFDSKGSLATTHESQGSTRGGGGLEASLNDLLRIHVSEAPAEGAYLSVQYRGFWFWHVAVGHKNNAH